LTFVPMDESTFRIRGDADKVTFAYDGDHAVSVTQHRRDGTTVVFKRVEGK
jgi:hypothetical protein